MFKEEEYELPDGFKDLDIVVWAVQDESLLKIWSEEQAFPDEPIFGLNLFRKATGYETESRNGGRELKWSMYALRHGGKSRVPDVRGRRVAKPMTAACVGKKDGLTRLYIDRTGSLLGGLGLIYPAGSVVQAEGIGEGGWVGIDYNLKPKGDSEKILTFAVILKESGYYDVCHPEPGHTHVVKIGVNFKK